MTGNGDIARDAAAEIRDLHVFLVGWFVGMLPRTSEAFARFADVMDPAFNIIGPSGQITTHSELLRGLEAAHGSRAKTDPPFAIRIENISVLRIWDGQALMAYEEWQDVPEGTTARQSSVLFGRTPDAPHGLHWLHLHESWIEGHAPPA